MPARRVYPCSSMDALALLARQLKLSSAPCAPTPCATMGTTPFMPNRAAARTIPPTNQFNPGTTVPFFNPTQPSVATVGTFFRAIPPRAISRITSHLPPRQLAAWADLERQDQQALASANTMGNAPQQMTEPHTPHPAQVLPPRQLTALADLKRQNQQAQTSAKASQSTNLVSAPQQRTEQTRRRRRIDSGRPSPRCRECSRSRSPVADIEEIILEDDPQGTSDAAATDGQPAAEGHQGDHRAGYSRPSVILRSRSMLGLQPAQENRWS